MRSRKQSRGAAGVGSTHHLTQVQRPRPFSTTVQLRPRIKPGVCVASSLSSLTVAGSSEVPAGF